MEASGGPNAEELKEALSGLQPADLKVMGQRIVQSQTSLQEALSELLSESDVLKEDNAKIRSTIELVLRDLNKLNIGADNLNDPGLEEGPLDFVGRFWERVRPRDSAYVVDEHIGEIRKPDADAPEGHEVFANALGQLNDQVAERFTSISDSLSEAANGLLPAQESADGETPGTRLATQGQELATQVAEQGQQIGRHVSERITSLSDSVAQATGALDFDPEQLGHQAAERTQKLTKKVTERFSSFSSSVSDSVSDGISRATADDADVGQMVADKGKELHKQATEQFSGAWSMLAQTGGSFLQSFQGGYPSADTGMDPAEFYRKPAAEEDGRPPAAEATRDSPQDVVGAASASSPASPVKSAPPASAAAPASPLSPGAGDSDDGASVLIEAKLRLGEDYVGTLRVKASDRCGQVAAKFVSEHSLKACFEAPLKAYLMQAEAEAEKFPVRLEEDLDEIRAKHAVRAPSP